MALNFKQALKKLLGMDDGKDEKPGAKTIEDEQIEMLWAYRLGLNIVAETLGGLISKCEFKTFVRNEEKRSDNYYLLNVEPNPNQSAAEFKRAIIRSLIYRPSHDALIVIINNHMYVAQDFTKTETQLYSAVFTNVSLDVFGDNDGFILSRAFSPQSHDCIYINYHSNQLNLIFQEMLNLYHNLSENARKAGTYRSKYVISMDQTASGDPEFGNHLQDILDNQFEKFINGTNAVIPMYAGMKLDQISAGADLGQNASTANSSVDKQVDEALTKVGLAFNFPSSVMLGGYEEGDLEHLLTFSVDVFAKLITDAFNRCYYSKDAYLKGTYCSLTTERARHVDYFNIGSVSNNIISSGIFTINDVLRKMNEPTIDPAIGDVHFITRNYAVIGSAYLGDPTNIVSPDQPASYQENAGGNTQKQDNGGEEENDSGKE